MPTLRYGRKKARRVEERESEKNQDLQREFDEEEETDDLQDTPKILLTSDANGYWA